MKKTKKQLDGLTMTLKKKLLTIAAICVVPILGVVANCVYMRYMYGNRHIETFPFEKLNDLRDEPDWRNENAFDNILYDKEQSRELMDWIESLDENTGIVNKSGTPMPLKKLIPMFGTPFGCTLYNNNGNLVVIYDTLSCKLERIEFFSTTKVKGNNKYIAVEETIIDDLNSYIDYEDNNTLYYYVDDGMHKILPIEEGVKQLQGICLYRCLTNFPILQKDGIIYTYILEDSEGSMYDHMYRTKAIRVKKIIISALEVKCEVKRDEIIIIPDSPENEHLYIWLYLKEDVELQEGVYNLQDIMPMLIQEESFIVEKEFEKRYFYIKRSDRYNDNELY